MITFLIILYAIVAILIPIIAVVADSPDPDPVLFVLSCTAALVWPILCPFILLWGVAMLIAKAIG